MTLKSANFGFDFRTLFPSRTGDWTSSLGRPFFLADPTSSDDPLLFGPDRDQPWVAMFCDFAADKRGREGYGKREESGAWAYRDESRSCEEERFWGLKTSSDIAIPSSEELTVSGACC